MLKVYKKEGKKQSDPQFYLQLQESELVEGAVDLVVVDKDGQRQPRGFLLTLSEDGLARHDCIKPEFGLKLNSREQLKAHKP